MTTIKQLKALYESDEHKALIDSNHWSKLCTAGTGENETGFEGCSEHKPLYEFPLIASDKEQYRPDVDGAKRKSICKDCLKRYNNMIQSKRRSQRFNKKEAIEIVSTYVKLKLGYDPDTSEIFLTLKHSDQESYTFLRVEQIKKQIKKELLS